MSGSEVVHRVAGLPGGTSKPAAKAILEQIFGPGIEITVRSVGINPLDAPTVVATLILSPVPSQLKGNSKSTISEVVRLDGQLLHLHLEIDTDFLGFTPLNIVDDSKPGQIDCIFVSGLSSHAYGSWKERGGRFMWPVDTEDRRPPHARFLLWGYNSSLVDSVSFQDIEDIGESLSTALKGIHPFFAQDEKSDHNLEFEARPIIFIAHSLGGLIVKDAIRQMAKDSAYIKCIYGLVFFGVPHHGLLVEPWLQIIGQRANADLVRSLKPESRVLQRLDEDFRKAFRVPGSRVISVYETMQSSTTQEESPGIFRRSGSSQVLVSRSSACGTWPKSVLYTPFAINRTHEDLPKFKGRYDDCLLRLWPFLRQMWAEANEAVQNRFGTSERCRLSGRAQVVKRTENKPCSSLIQVWPDVESYRVAPPETEMDVIAIHGLGGHPIGTWTSGEKNWLQHFLPSEIPGIRVSSFSYNSELAFGGSGSRFRSIAQNLLDDLLRLWKGDQHQNDRKIVFICHSLGGLIFKQALLLANESGTHTSTFIDSITGVLFLGTPNKGNQVSFWSDLFGKIAKLESLPDFGGASSESMRSVSYNLGITCSEFNGKVASKIQIFSFYEQLESSEIGSLVVDQASAILRLPTEIIIPLEADHNGLSRFLTNSSGVYRTICKCFMELMEADNPSTSQFAYADFTVQTFVKRLKDFDETKTSIAFDSALRRSTRWIIDHPDFTTWSDNTSQHVLWLHGPPGSGKTVLMESIVNYLAQRVQVSSTHIIYKAVHFFFDVKNPYRNSSLAFIKSVLAQIIDDDETGFVFKYLDRLDHYKAKRFETEDELWAYLFTIIQKSRGIIFQLVIDGLDEALRGASSGSMTIVDRLHELLAVDLGGRVRLFISHREERPSDISLTQDVRTISTQNNLTKMSVYEHIRMKVRSSLEDSGIPTSLGESIQKKIMEACQGNYLHATLVWQHFTQGVQAWTIEEVSRGLRRLDTLSHDLISSYCRLLNRIDPSYRARARTAFAILSVCREKLYSRELAFLATLYEKIESTDGLQNLPRDMGDMALDLVPDCTDFEAYLSKSCWYLIKKARDGTIDFAHTSVKDLFTGNQADISPEYATTLSNYAISAKAAHGIMRSLCSTILHLEINNQANWIQLVTKTMGRMTEAEESRFQDEVRKHREASEQGKTLEQKSLIETIEDERQDPGIQRTVIESMSRTPCFVYSIFHWLEHYEAALPSRVSDEQYAKTLVSHVGQVSHMLWVFMTRDTLPHHDRSYTISLEHAREICLFRIISRGDHPALAKALIDQGANVNYITSILYNKHGRPEEHGIAPLSWAIVCQRQKTLDILLKNETTEVNGGLRRSPKPLHFAVSRAGAYYIEKIVQHPNCNINVTDHKGTPLHLALHLQNYKAVEVILDQEYADVWAKDHRGESAYTRTFKRGIWGSIFEKLLQASKKDTREALAERIEGSSQLSMAGAHGWTNVEAIILREDLQQLFLVDPDTRMSPLITTAYLGRKKKLLWMLDRVPPTGVQLRRDSDQFDLLHLCADQDWEDVVQLIQRKYGLKSLSSDHKGRTLLHWAIEYGWDMDHFSLSESKNVLDMPDRDGLAAIHLAVLTRNMELLRALVAAGANCLLTEKNRMTPAHLAADTGFREALELFIDMPIREFGRTRTGASLLHLIACWFDGTIVRRFVSRKRALLDICDKNRCTPLHYAAMANNLSSVDALVAMGCNINARNTSWRTPLHEAIRSGSVGTTLLLLKLGADYHAIDAFDQTCLLMVYRYGIDPLVSRFMSLGCNINAIDVFKMTPLHRACANGNAILILQLLKLGANWRLKNRSRRSVLDLAVESRNQVAVREILAWLRKNYGKSKTRERMLNRALEFAIQEEYGVTIEQELERFHANVDRKSIVVRRIYNTGLSPESSLENAIIGPCKQKRKRTKGSYPIDPRGETGGIAMLLRGNWKPSNRVSKKGK